MEAIQPARYDQDITFNRDPYLIGDAPRLGVIVIYAHVTEIAVKVGDRVKAGQVVAKLGNNGQTRAPGIHIGAYREADAMPLQIRWDLRAMAKKQAEVGVR